MEEVQSLCPLFTKMSKNISITKIAEQIASLNLRKENAVKKLDEKIETLEKQISVKTEQLTKLKEEKKMFQ